MASKRVDEHPVPIDVDVLDRLVRLTTTHPHQVVHHRGRDTGLDLRRQQCVAAPQLAVGVGVRGLLHWHRSKRAALGLGYRRSTDRVICDDPVVELRGHSLTQRLPVGPALAAYSALAALLAPLVVIDARDQRLPTKPMIVAAATTTIMFIAFAAVDHEPGPLLRALASSGTCVLLLVITYLITSGFIGGGDIRLAALLVLALGWTGWSAAARSIMIGLIIGAMYSQYLRLRLRLGPLAHIPLGPALALGALSSILID